MNKKVAIIDPVGGQAGIDDYDKGLAQGMLIQGIDVSIFGNFSVDEGSGIYSEQLFFKEKDGGVWRYVNFLIGHIRAMIRCRKLGIKLVIIHFFAAHVKELVVYSIVRLFGIRVLTIVHDVSSLSNTSGSRSIEKYVFGLSRHLVVHNEYSKRELFKLLRKEHQERVKVIKHGGFQDINFEEDETVVELDKKKINILFFGQIKKVKGLDLLLECFPQVHDKAHLIIAGKTWKDDFGNYQEIIDKHNLQDRVTPILRFISDEEREYLLRNCQLIVLPYRKIYQSGVLLLAMTKGIPIVASDLDPNKEVIVPGRNGFLFESEDVQDLVRVLNEVINLSPQELTAIAERARKLMDEDYSWVDIAANYLDLID